MTKYVVVEESNGVQEALRHILRPLNIVTRIKEKQLLKNGLDESPCYYCKTPMNNGATTCSQCGGYRTAQPSGIIGRILATVSFCLVVTFVLGILAMFGEGESHGITVVNGVVMTLISIAGLVGLYFTLPVAIYWYRSSDDAEY